MENNSYIHPNAKIGANVEIGPFCYIAENVEIGDGCKIGPHVTIYDYVKMGSNCKVFPGAVIGAIPQDMKFHGEVTYVEIGNNVTIRECATINRGTEASGKGVTKVGDNTLVMSYVHIAHDCVVGRNCILVSFVGLAGETDVEDWAIIGGSSAVHQFSKIGQHAMLSGGSMVGKDVPPYALAGKRPLSYVGVNVIGLRRRGFSSEQIERIRDIYRVIYDSDMNVSDACRKVEETFEQTPEKRAILDFIASSKRGIIKRNPNVIADED